MVSGFTVVKHGMGFDSQNYGEDFVEQNYTLGQTSHLMYSLLKKIQLLCVHFTMLQLIQPIFSLHRSLVMNCNTSQDAEGRETQREPGGVKFLQDSSLEMNQDVI